MGIYNRISKCDLPRTNKHNLLQDEIIELANKYGFVGKREYKIKIDSWGNRIGKIDVAWVLSEKLEFVIEIDSSFRQKSVEKLINATCDNKIWLCYSYDKNKFNKSRRLDVSNNIVYITPNISKR